jgi:hypothetical protein
MAMSCGPTAPDGADTQASDDTRVVENAAVPYGDLTEKDHVLENLELSYNERNLVEFDKLLDANFVFFFSPADVQNGTVPFSQWDRTSELSATANLFAQIPSGIPLAPTRGAGPIEERTWGSIKTLFHAQSSGANSLNLTMIYPPGDGSWIAIAAPPPFSGETWYQKTASYSIIVTIGDTTFLGTNINMTITIRPNVVGQETLWRIVQWRDDVP